MRCGVLRARPRPLQVLGIIIGRSSRGRRPAGVDVPAGVGLSVALGPRVGVEPAAPLVGQTVPGHKGQRLGRRVVNDGDAPADIRLEVRLILALALVEVAPAVELVDHGAHRSVDHLKEGRRGRVERAGLRLLRRLGRVFVNAGEI